MLPTIFRIVLKFNAALPALFVLLACSAVTLAGCGKRESKEPAKAAESSETGTTHGTLNQQVEFFSERYLSADERLRRRQERLREAVAGEIVEAPASGVVDETTSATDTETTTAP